MTALLFFFCLPQKAFSIPIGFNQAWFKNDFSTQYFDGYFNENEVSRIFSLVTQAGAKNLRLWFFESNTFPMLIWEADHIVGIRPDYINNVVKMLRIARLHDVKVYMTLLDSQMYRPDRQKWEELMKFRSLFQREGGQEFLEQALFPLLKAIQDAGLAGQISRIDLANELDAAINRFAFHRGWEGAGDFLCQWRAMIHGLESFKDTPVSFSIRLHPLLHLPVSVLSVQEGPMSCAEYLDFHSYGNSGKIHHCQRLKRYAQKSFKPLILGEFGQSFFDHEYDDALQVENTRNYIHSAEECGFVEALAWRLSDIREGYNREARYSFEAYGKMRPAYQVIRNHNLEP